MRKFFLLAINPTKGHDKPYFSTHYQGINQVERVLSDTARADGIVLVSRSKIERNRESRLSEKLVAGCLEVSFVEDIPSRVISVVG